MGKVLKADASSADAFVHVTLVSPPSETWLSYRLRFDSAAQAVFAANGGFFHQVRAFPSTGAAATFAGIGLGSNDWLDFGSDGGGGGTSVADAWMDIEVHVNAGVLVEFFMNSVSQYSFTETTGDPSFPEVYLGLLSSPADPANIAYFDDVKVSTTRGGDDLFADDFEDGTVGAWTSSGGAVSVVDDPFTAPSFTLPGVFDVAFTDPTLEAFPTWTAL